MSNFKSLLNVLLSLQIMPVKFVFFYKETFKKETFKTVFKGDGNEAAG